MALPDDKQIRQKEVDLDFEKNLSNYLFAHIIVERNPITSMPENELVTSTNRKMSRISIDSL